MVNLKAKNEREPQHRGTEFNDLCQRHTTWDMTMQNTLHL